MTLIFSITTGVVGTSLLNGPCAPVGTALILSTTSSPEMTLPNTQYPHVEPLASLV